jgi:hypothetical protein
MAREIESASNIAYVATLYEALRATDYGKSSIYVTELEIELIKAQQPNLLP